MRPLIGITAGLLREPPSRDIMYNTSDYFRAVQNNGGIPVLLPFCQTEAEAGEILSRLDGLLLSGGADIAPQLYGEQPHQRTGAVSPERDATEMALTTVALSRNLPVFGICRGHQVLAVATGGTLYQDIPAQVPGALKHAQEGPRWFQSHGVTIEPQTRLHGLLGDFVRVNSFHHQSVKAVPPGWVASAAASDGINEALEHKGYRFALTVQWHPENFSGRATNFDTLFQAFIEAC